jgi:cyanophycinase
MSVERKPLFLLADSQPLFRSGGDILLHALQESLHVAERNLTKAAYIGASNRDLPEFFDLFVAAMDHVNLHQSRMIPAGFDSDDRAFLESADLVLLAGGEADVGWETMERTGMDAVIRRKYYAGAVLVGVSAGAMQLGMGWRGADQGYVSKGLKLVPYYIAVHSERDDWLQLRTLVAAREEYAKGYGIPFGGALIYHADMSLEAVRYPVAEFERTVKENRKLSGSLLLPASRGLSVTPARQSINGKCPIAL